MSEILEVAMVGAVLLSGYAYIVGAVWYLHQRKAA